MTPVIAILAATILVTPPPQANAAMLWSLDTNDDGFINADELHDAVRGIIEPFDKDEDGELRTSDMHRLVFQLWDEDDDLALSRAEYTRTRDWHSGLNSTDFARLDGDGDNSLGLTEFMAFGDHGMYSRWDRDDSSLIDQFEITAHFIALFDEDEDGALNLDELGAAPLVWPVASTALNTIRIG